MNIKINYTTTIQRKRSNWKFDIAVTDVIFTIGGSVFVKRFSLVSYYYVFHIFV